MPLKEELEKHGEWLFKRRSYLPLLILPVILVTLKHSEDLERLLWEAADDLWKGFCVCLSFLGLIIRCVTVGYVPEGTSGRNTKRQKAKFLNTNGMYSIVRHPIYLGNFFIMLGMTLFVEVWWFTLFSVLAFWLYYERIIIAEEEFLQRKFGGLYLEWAEKTPAFLPKLRKWQRPSVSFSFRAVLAREYTTFFVITTYFAFIDITEDAFIENKLDLAWLIVFATGFILYLMLRTLKKKTRILYVKGR
ncbi:MAG: methyltransferase family protein [Candidatus Kryptoniota bacterium]